MELKMRLPPPGVPHMAKEDLSEYILWWRFISWDLGELRIPIEVGIGWLNWKIDINFFVCTDFYLFVISVCDFVIKNISKQYFLSDEINEKIYTNKRFGSLIIVIQREFRIFVRDIQCIKDLCLNGFVHVFISKISTYSHIHVDMKYASFCGPYFLLV